MTVRSPSHADPADQAPTVSARSGPGAVSLFEVPFASDMSDRDLARLASVLDLSTREHLANRPRHESPGLARLDHYSGLFLDRGATEGRWTLNGRTWGHPAPQSIHAWHVLAAGAARQLDPTVQLPERLSVSEREVPGRPLSRAQNKRLAALRRRVCGIANG